MIPSTLVDLRRFAVGHSLFSKTTLRRALVRLAFVQADPIRAPARAQDLILRLRVAGYRAGDLERQYAKLGVAEDFFINYGFVTPALQTLMHPRPDVTVPTAGAERWPAERIKRTRLLLKFVAAQREVHPREVDAHFAHGKVQNYWGGSSNATTHLLDQMHYRGLVRVVRREGGVRIYAAHEHARAKLTLSEKRARLDALVDVAVRIYAPLPGPSFSFYVRRLRFAVPQWRDEIGAAILRAKARLARVKIDGVDWYWTPDSPPSSDAPDERVSFLTPFDPLVHDRARFERLWGWVYRFEAYTPPAKRKLGYYALPLLWRDRVIGWANVDSANGELRVETGYVDGHSPRERSFVRELDAETERVRAFLRVTV